MGRHTCRDEVLAAFVELETRSGKTVFRLQEIVDHVMRSTDRYPPETLRTQISSVMCANAPVHHANHTNDLERVGHGLYRRITDGAPQTDKEGPQANLPTDATPWFWEGSVQDSFARYVVSQGWTIVSQADTRSRQTGTDIVAGQGQRRMLVEVKGFPITTYARGPKAGTPKPTLPATQARHWFAGAVLSAMMARDANPGSEIVIALPSFDTYRKLIERARDSLSVLAIRCYLLEQDRRWQRVV